MKLVRFLKKSYHADRIIEPGEEVFIGDDVVLGPHMVDLTSDTPAPEFREADSGFRSVPLPVPAATERKPWPEAKPWTHANPEAVKPANEDEQKGPHMDPKDAPAATEPVQIPHNSLRDLQSTTDS